MAHRPTAVTGLNLEHVLYPDKRPAPFVVRLLPVSTETCFTSGVDEPLRAPLEIGFDYTRSLGPVLSQFMTGLARRRILGSRGADGRVHAPPFEYDPVTFAPAGEPLEGQPLAHPFAWALIRLDGADTAMLHAVDAGSAAAMRTGLRVRARWAESPAGHIRDIACFDPCPADAAAGPPETAQLEAPPPAEAARPEALPAEAARPEAPP